MSLQQLSKYGKEWDWMVIVGKIKLRSDDYGIDIVSTL